MTVGLRRENQNVNLVWASPPFGVDDIEEGAAVGYVTSKSPLRKEKEVRCCIRNCRIWMPARTGRGPYQYCPDHGISVSTSPTYVYEDWRRNFLIGRDLIETVKQQKTESWRLGNESSEDALSWNVFVGLAGIGALEDAFEFLTGERPKSKPRLFFWGVEVWPAYAKGTWSRLHEARERCGELARSIRTEPDVMLFVEGQALVLVEAKFGSPNGVLAKKKPAVTVADFLSRYPAPNCADPLDRAAIANTPAEEVLEQLCRNVLFARYMTRDRERPFVANLVRSSDEKDTEARMGRHLNANAKGSFRRLTWEDLGNLSAVKRPEASALNRYLWTKTLRLEKAFELS